MRSIAKVSQNTPLMFVDGNTIDDHGARIRKLENEIKVIKMIGGGSPKMNDDGTIDTSVEPSNNL